jgi:hypothetical protein
MAAEESSRREDAELSWHVLERLESFETSETLEEMKVVREIRG